MSVLRSLGTGLVATMCVAVFTVTTVGIVFTIADPTDSLDINAATYGLIYVSVALSWTIIVVAFLKVCILLERIAKRRS